jgi:hypothetical protein
MSEALVNINLDMKINKEGLYYIFVTVEINNDESAYFGYSIEATGATVFEFEEGVPEEEKKDLLSSGVNISIINLRSYINAAIT